MDTVKVPWEETSLLPIVRAAAAFVDRHPIAATETTIPKQRTRSSIFLKTRNVRIIIYPFRNYPSAGNESIRFTRYCITNNASYIATSVPPETRAR